MLRTRQAAFACYIYSILLQHYLITYVSSKAAGKAFLAALRLSCTLQGGLRATFLAAWSHTALIYIALVSVFYPSHS